MPPRPVPRPHFTSLGFTWLSLRASHRLALRLLVLPPSRRAPPPSSHTRPPFAPSSPSLLARARSPPSAPRLPSPSLSAAPLARLDLTLSSPPTPFSSCSSAPCSSSSAPTKHSHRPFVHKSTEKRFFVSSRLVSSPSTRFAPFSPFPRLLLPLSSFFLPCSPSAASSSFVLLPVLLSPGLLSRSLSARTARYKLFQKFVLLLLSLNHSQRRRAGDEHSSPVQCATLFAPRRLRQFDDSEGGDGDDES